MTDVLRFNVAATAHLPVSHQPPWNLEISFKTDVRKRIRKSWVILTVNGRTTCSNLYQKHFFKHGANTGYPRGRIPFSQEQNSLSLSASTDYEEWSDTADHLSAGMTKYRKGLQRTTKDRKGALLAKLQEIGTN